MNQPSERTPGTKASLDALDAILPFETRGRIEDVLSPEDITTLKHLASEGMGANTLRAFASDIAYIEAWCLLAIAAPLPWPAPQSLLVKFVAHHLWDPAQREKDPAHGMPDDVAEGLRRQGLLRSSGPHAPATVRRRLTSWSVLTKWRGLTGEFAGPALKQALRLAVRATARPRQRKSRKAVTSDVLAKLLATCATSRPADLRDKALLMLAFASGGRRRSEIASLRVGDCIDEEPVLSNPADPDSPTLPCMMLHLGRTKTTAADDAARVALIGRPVAALKAWLKAARIDEGPIFRKIDQWGNVDAGALTPQSVNLIVKSRAKQAGLDPALFSAHGLRAGYLTEAASRGIPLTEAMQQSLHKSVTQAASYYNDSERKMGRAGRLMA